MNDSSDLLLHLQKKKRSIGKGDKPASRPNTQPFSEYIIDRK